jgi:FkbM family methyltransferase
MKIRNRTPLWRRIVRYGGRRLLHFADGNPVSRIDRNGELWLIRGIMSLHSSGGIESRLTVIDAGANEGDYSDVVLREARKRGREIALHAIEPSPRCAARLKARFADRAEVRIVQAALGNRSGTALLYGGNSGSAHASLVSREVLTGAGMIEVPLMRLDDYLSEHSIETVHLLKLDVEGFELSALEGLGDKLNPDFLQFIQFEYGGATLDAGTSLRGLYRLLSKAGYLVAKLFPRVLEVRRYNPGMEYYAYSNFVAFSPRWQDLERKRGGPP